MSLSSKFFIKYHSYIALSKSLRRKALKSQIGKVRKIFGINSSKLSSIANRLGYKFFGIRMIENNFFAKVANKKPQDVVYWLVKLKRDEPAKISSFVRDIFRITENGNILLELGQNPISRESVRAYLKNTPIGDIANIVQQKDTRVSLSIAIYALYWHYFMTSNPELVRSARKQLNVKSNRHIASITHSLGIDLSKITEADNFDYKSCHADFKHVKSRLVFCGNPLSIRSLGKTLIGAEQATIVCLHDIYGKIDIEELKEISGVSDIKVEHVRSRVNRFSEAYTHLNQETVGIVDTLLLEVEKKSPSLSKIVNLFLPTLSLGLIDGLFFFRLKVKCVAALLKDETFSSIVVAIESSKRDREFLSILNSVSGLTHDRRVTFMSLSNTFSKRQEFDSQINTLMQCDFGLKPDGLYDIVDPVELIKIAADKQGEQLASRVINEPADIFVATTNNTAYNFSTASYINILSNNNKIHAVTSAQNISFLLNQNLKQVPDKTQVSYQTLASPLPEECSLIEARLLFKLLETIKYSDMPELELAKEYILLGHASKNLVSGVFNCLVIEAYFAALSKANAQPKLLVLTACRDATILPMVFAARRHNVPSIILEPHGIDANYSRYIKIASDYYGVISSYFNNMENRGFHIDKNRTFVIGSPRIIAPKINDRQKTIKETRNQIEISSNFSFPSEKKYICFFCQPIIWKQMSAIWENVLLTAKEYDLVILHKAHPEEGKARLDDYKRIVEKTETQERVVWTHEKPETVINASDLMLTVYSAAALESVLHRCPVICVSNGQKILPINQHKLINAPLATSQKELSKLIGSFLEKPDMFTDKIDKFLKDEPQLVEGPEPYLEQVIKDIISKGAGNNIRNASNVGNSLILDPPYPTFDI